MRTWPAGLTLMIGGGGGGGGGCRDIISEVGILWGSQKVGVVAVLKRLPNPFIWSWLL